MRCLTENNSGPRNCIRLSFNCSYHQLLELNTQASLISESSIKSSTLPSLFFLSSYFCCNSSTRTMFSRLNSLLCLVALATSLVTALPLTPTSTLVSRQEGNPQRELFCRYNPLDCQRDFPWYCQDMTKPSPEWCDVVSTPVPQLDTSIIDIPTDDDHSLIPRQVNQESPEEILRKQTEFCYKNEGYCLDFCMSEDWGFCDEVHCRVFPSRCRKMFSDVRCHKWGGPWWCDPDADAPPVSPPVLKREVTNTVEGGPSDHNEARELFCRYNPLDCRRDFPSLCKGNKEDVPSWCDPTLDETSVAEPGNPQRELYCLYNPEKCREAFPSYCIGNKEDIPSWCDPNAAPPIPASEAETSNLVARSPQDDPEKQDPEEPHPIERSWCKKHPNHPYCYSQFCRDHPGSCIEVAVDSAAIPPPPLPTAQATVTATTVTKEYMVSEKTAASSQVATPSSTSKGGDNTPSLYKRGGWYCLWLC